MAAKLKIKMLKAWSMHTPGTVLDLDASVANELIKCGKAEVYTPPTEMKTKLWRGAEKRAPK